jgi:hypothetical protein
LVGITCALFITDQPYAFGKMILSLGFPLVALAVFGVDRFAATYKPLTQYAAIALMIFWIARSGTSIILMNTPPMLPPQLAVMRSVRSHVDELPDDVQRIHPLLTSAQDLKNQKVAVVGYPGSLKGTDGDRVIAFAIWHQLVGTTQHYFPGPPLGGNAHGGSYEVISDRLTLEKQLRDGEFDALIVMNDELELLPLSRYTLYHRGERFSLFARAS